MAKGREQRGRAAALAASVSLGLGLGCALGDGGRYSSGGAGSGDAGSSTAGDETSTPIDSADSGGPSVCGNGELEEGELCDDGNDDDRDECTIACAPPRCDDGLLGGDETDLDCGGTCDPCEPGSGCVLPGDCDTGYCNGSGSCAHPRSCQALLDAVPSVADGQVMIDPDGEGGGDPFNVDCDMQTDGGGWIRLSLQHSDGVVVGQDSAGNPWTKCGDDGAAHFGWIDEGTISADLSPGSSFDEEIALSYQNPGDGTIYTTAQVEALRSLVTELNASTRMVAVTADDDNADWHTDMMTGHEVYIRGSAGVWTLLTPGTNGNCGGAADWPAVDSQSAFYLWSHEDDTSVVDGDTTSVDEDLPGLDAGDLLPEAVRLVVQTGGGVAFGWEQVVFLVR